MLAIHGRRQMKSIESTGALERLMERYYERKSKLKSSVAPEYVPGHSTEEHEDITIVSNLVLHRK
jgi:hypothetical protein